MDLAAAAERDVVETWCALASGRPDPRAGVERHPGLVVASLGMGVPFFNGAFVTGEADAEATVRTATAFYEARRRPFLLRARPERDDVAQAAAHVGMSEVQPLDLLAMQMPATMPEPPEDLRIQQVRDVDGLAGHVAVLAAAFELPVEIMAGFLADVPLRDARLRVLNGHVGDRIVTTSAVCLHGEIAGVYDVATLPSHRGRGLGEAMTWQAMRVAADAGARVVSLQPSPMGLPIYNRMGFDRVGAFRQWEWRPAPADT